MTALEYLLKASAYLERNRVTSARLCAELLLSSVLGISRIEIYTGYDRPLSRREADAYRELLVRRARGWPLQYLVGETGFMGLTLRARPGVFIPRPETEVLVEKALERLPGDAREALDVCCGCGNIAVALAVNRPGLRVTATDSSLDAVALARENAELCGVADRVEVLRGDLYAPAAGPPERFDMIISNPPYVPSGCRESLPDEVREHEPPEALFAGEDGLDVIRRLAGGAPAVLRPGGLLALEVDESHAEEVAAVLLSDWGSVELFDDLAGRPRAVVARRPDGG